jgi:putative redox protein
MISSTSDSPRYRTRFSDGTHEGIADTTADKGGNNGAFRPHGLLEAALATCVNMAVQMYADAHAIPLAGVTTMVNSTAAFLTKPYSSTKSNSKAI